MVDKIECNWQILTRNLITYWQYPYNQHIGVENLNLLKRKENVCDE